MTFVPGQPKYADWDGRMAASSKAPPPAPSPEKDYLDLIREMEEAKWRVVVVFTQTEYITIIGCRIKETVETLTLREDDGTVTTIPKHQMRYYTKTRMLDDDK